MKGTRVLQGTLCSAKQSSAELMAASSYPGRPYKSKPPAPLPPSTLSLFCLGPHSLGTKESFQMETLFLWKQEGRVEGIEDVCVCVCVCVCVGGGRSSWGGFLGSMLKPIFVWESGTRPLTASSSHISQRS